MKGSKTLNWSLHSGLFFFQEVARAFFDLGSVLDFAFSVDFFAVVTLPEHVEVKEGK
jgi:hypothetical protein